MSETVQVQLLTVISTILVAILTGIGTLINKNLKLKTNNQELSYENYYLNVIFLLYEFHYGAVKWSVVVGAKNNDDIKELLLNNLQYLSPKLAVLRNEYIPLTNKMFSFNGYQKNSFTYQEAPDSIKETYDKVDKLFNEIIQLTLEDALKIEKKLNKPLLSLPLLENICNLKSKSLLEKIRIQGLWLTVKQLLIMKKHH